MKKIILSLFLTISFSAGSQNATEFLFGDAALLDVEKAEYFEVDFLYSCGSVFQNLSAKPLINKTDISGNLYWSKQIEVSENQLSVEEMCVFSEDEIYVMGGFSGNGNFTGSLLKLNGDGDISFLKSIETNSLIFLEAIAKTPDDHVLVSGVSDSDILILKFDTLGNLVNHVRLETVQNEIINDLTVDEEGDIFLVGGYADPFTNANQKGLIVKLNENLEILWSKTIHRESSLDQTFFEVKACANDGVNTTIVLEATGEGSPEMESGYQDIGLVNLNELGEIVSENIIDLGEYELLRDLTQSEQGDLFVTGNVFASPTEWFSAFVLSLDAQLEPISANLHSREFDDLLMHSSTIISENPIQLATVGETSVNQFYRGLQTHHSFEADLCTASEMVPTTYDPDFILEDIEMEVSDLDFTISDVEFEVTTAFFNLSVFCSETLSNPSVTSADNIQIYPNPCFDYFQIEGLSKPSNLSVKDVSGRTIREIRYANGRVNIEDLPQGLYLIEIDGIQTFRLVKN